MRAHRSGSLKPSVGLSSSSCDSPLTDKEKEALRLEALQQLNTSIVAQWQQRKHRPAPSQPLSSLHPHSSPIRFKTSFRNTILSVFHERGWIESHDEVEWDVHWTSKEWTKGVLPKIHLFPHQLVNHFRNYYELTRKDLLIKNLKRKRNQWTRQGNHEAAAAYHFFPETFSLPSEYSMFVDAFRRGGGTGMGGMGNSWIMKPIGSSQGKGIFLMDKLSQIAEWSSHLRASEEKGGEDEAVERYVVQRYIGNPLLIGHKKFDLRIYVLVTSYSPLIAYMHRAAFARFSSTRYSTGRGELGNSYVHLTNVAIQKHGQDYDEQSGGKWDVAGLRAYLSSNYPPHLIAALFSSITSLVLRSLLAVQPIMVADPHCFELYGYDVLLDDALKPWLIEVNASPSLSANTQADERMKKEMLHDTFHVLEAERRRKGRGRRGREERVGGFDLLYDERGMRLDGQGQPLNCLGLWYEREPELKRMWKRMNKEDDEDEAEREAKLALQREKDKRSDKQREKGRG